jgi:hypothetical protein
MMAEAGYNRLVRERQERMMTAGVLIAALYWVVTWAALGRWIGARMAGRSGAGLVLGLLLGPLGCAIALSLRTPPAPPPPDPLRAMAAPAKPRKPAAPASVPCPCCGVALAAAALVSGRHVCPTCKGQFAVE